MQLNVHFISGTKQGDFLGAEDEVMRVTQSVVYVRGRLSADDRLIAHADGEWNRLGVWQAQPCSSTP